MPLTRRSHRTVHPPVTVYLIEADDAMRASIERLLNRTEDFVLVGSTYDGATGLDAIADLEPDVAIVSSRLDDGDGLGVIRALRGRSLHTHAIMFTSSEELRVDALEAGACGFASKSAPISQLVTLVRATAHGRAFACRARVPAVPMRPIRQSA